MAILSGERLGSYEILSSIGAGGMGEVYCARDARLNRTIAGKLLELLLGIESERAKCSGSARSAKRERHDS